MSALARKQVEFYFDFGSPTAYLAYTQLPKITAAHDAEIVWRPMLLGSPIKMGTQMNALLKQDYPIQTRVKK